MEEMLVSTIGYGVEKEGIPSDSMPSLSASGDAIPGTSEANNQPSSSQKSVYYPPVTSYGYIPQADKEGYSNTAGGSYTGGMQSDNSPQFYYHAGYGYTSVDGPNIFSNLMGQKPFHTTDMIQLMLEMPRLVLEMALGNQMLQNPITIHPAKFQLRLLIQMFNTLLQPSSGYQRPAGNFYQNPGVYMQYGPVNYQSSGGRVWNNNYRNRSRENLGRNVGNEASIELTRGPRADNKNNSSRVQPGFEQPVVTIEKEKYNLQEFQTEYDNAKFFVIKSYSEDDIHKSIKYNVWSSTTNGNKKLDAAYTEADAKTRETGTICHVFLFFSVNGSGQFVGVAEMIGHVDFSKNMDFWQGYSGGVEMLSIFKSYSEKTSVVEDFNFYENREKSLRAKRYLKAANESDASSLVSLTENLSLDS
ncbi:hypothetical protein RD792_014567 [Penstemon davidsonii]|uniref:YTH domain-containing family protein n=1 Tax=Penstemon davidsonii TaxID=160366 RepID=A0ABR0CPN5_9LAMI|nr:hypothetical protein RD792_014567 [Penstemon davidsonii]